MPSLAERTSDVPLLAEHFLQARDARPTGAAAWRSSRGALEWLEDQPWPGNIRQLEHAGRARAAHRRIRAASIADDLRRTLAMDLGSGRDHGAPVGRQHDPARRSSAP